MSDNMGIQNELVHHYETAVRSADAAGVMVSELSQRNPRCSSTPFLHKFNQLKRPYVDILTEISRYGFYQPKRQYTTRFSIQIKGKNLTPSLTITKLERQHHQLIQKVTTNKVLISSISCIPGE